MNDLQIRPAISTDLTLLMAMDHTCETDYVWQMEYSVEEGRMAVNFRKMRLPRTVSVDYPRPVQALSESWSRRSGMLVASLAGDLAGYLRVNDTILPRVAWLTDVVVAPRYRRSGIACALIQAAHAWAIDRQAERALFEMLPKNDPAIRLAQKMGYEFCGYNDQYYERQDVALFFGRSLR